MPSYGDLFIDLKEKKEIHIKDAAYTNHAIEWVKINIFHKELLTEDEDESVKSFVKRFVMGARDLSKKVGGQGHMYFGYNPTVDNFLTKNIPLVYACDCSKCKGDVEMKDVDETEKQR